MIWIGVTMKTFTIPTKPYDNYRLYKKKNITINSGVTVLVGCNGSGKSTIIQRIKETLENEKIPVLTFDNHYDGDRRLMQKALYYGEMSLLAQLFMSSEGEKINSAICNFAQQVGNYVRANQDIKELWILFDAVDSGYSIDNIVEFKQDFINTVLEDCQGRGVDIHIIISANSYEMTVNLPCFDVWSGEYITFKSYEDYKKFIIKTRERKDKRCKNV